MSFHPPTIESPLSEEGYQIFLNLISISLFSKSHDASKKHLNPDFATVNLVKNILYYLLYIEIIHQTPPHF
jgi:hypothetical protein